MAIKNNLIACVTAVILAWLSTVTCDKLRVCVVDGHGGYRKAERYCPILDDPSSKVECIIGLDRLDCLRRISKGKADFSVFTSEDLITARNSQIEVLITNEMRFTKDKFEYEVVAVIADNAQITNRYDLRDKKLCHPGYGYQEEWTQILANYLEASVVPQFCEETLTLTENRISASSDYFKAACKAGPWVKDLVLDRKLKKKYPTLCELCGNPVECNKRDKYWGRRGPLYCLTDGVGDIAWVRLDDVLPHFGLAPGTNTISPQGYSYLCPDGSIVPVNSTKPCVWVAKPWPVIATKKTSAILVQELVATLSHEDPYSWQSALLNLIETYHVTVSNVEPIEAIENYLSLATGFSNANSFTGCHPPRTIRICTTSNIENAKCGWMREAAAVYGVEPDIDCLKADNKLHCIQAIKEHNADIVVVPPDLVHSAQSEHNLQTLFYETVNDENKYITVALVHKNSQIKTFKDLKGAKACFPIYDGVAWNSVVHSLNSRNLLNSCPFINGMSEYFGDSCVPGLPNNASLSLKRGCQDDLYEGEYGAIKCLVQGGDVAFISNNSFTSFFQDLQQKRTLEATINDFKILCDSQPCHLSWAPAGQAMVRANSSKLWLEDTLDVFFHIDNLFGKDYHSNNVPFNMYELFDGKSDVLFHNATVRLRNVPTVKNTDKMVRNYDNILSGIKECSLSSASSSSSTLFILLLNIAFLLSLTC